MPYITISDGLTIKVPVKGTTDWADTMQTDTFQKISEHDHSGAGKGIQLAASAIADDSVTNLKIRLANDGYLRGRDNANSTDINIIKVNTSDKLEFGADINNFDIINDTYLRAKNNADSGYINILKIDTSDEIDMPVKLKLGDSLDVTNNIQISGGFIAAQKNFTIANNQTDQDVTGLIVTAADNFKFEVKYGIYIDADTDLRESGTLVFTYDGSSWNIVKEYEGDDSGVSFSITAAGQVQYSSDNYTGYSDGDLYYIATTLGV